MGTFEAFYASPTQHPFLLWAGALVAIVYCATRADLPPKVLRVCLGLGALSLADAWLTSAHVYGIGSLQGQMASGVPLFFVLAGDFRFLWVAIAGRAGGQLEFDGRGVAIASGLTAIVPITTQVVLQLIPNAAGDPRVMFFVYEVLFVSLTIGLLRFNQNVRESAWLTRISRYVIVYYSLWATSDLIILATGADFGYLLRVVPNVLYYGGLIAVIGWSAEKATLEAPA